MLGRCYFSLWQFIGTLINCWAWAMTIEPELLPDTGRIKTKNIFVHLTRAPTRDHMNLHGEDPVLGPLLVSLRDLTLQVWWQTTWCWLFGLMKFKIIRFVNMNMKWVFFLSIFIQSGRDPSYTHDSEEFSGHSPTIPSPVVFPNWEPLEYYVA